MSGSLHKMEQRDGVDSMQGQTNRIFTLRRVHSSRLLSKCPLQDLGIPSVQEAIAMSARDPLSTVLHYDVGVRVLLAWLTGIRM